MKRTYPEAIDEKQTFIDTLKTGELEDSIINLSTKLALIPADSSLANLSDIIAKTDIVKNDIFLNQLLIKLKEIMILTIYLLMYHQQ